MKWNPNFFLQESSVIKQFLEKFGFYISLDFWENQNIWICCIHSFRSPPQPWRISPSRPCIVRSSSFSICLIMIRSFSFWSVSVRHDGRNFSIVLAFTDSVHRYACESGCSDQKDPYCCCNTQYPSHIFSSSFFLQSLYQQKKSKPSSYYGCFLLLIHINLFTIFILMLSSDY